MKENHKKTSNLDVAEFSEKEFPAVTQGIEEPTQQEHLEITYNLTGDEVKAGLKRFQREYGKARKIIYTVLCSIIAFINVADLIIRGNSNQLAYLFIGVSLAIIFVVWCSPKWHRDKIAKAIESESMNFTMSLYPEFIFIREQSGGFRVLYSDTLNKCIEMKDKFVICVGKERIYVLPKRCLTEEQCQKAKQYFKNMKEQFLTEID